MPQTFDPLSLNYSDIRYVKSMMYLTVQLSLHMPCHLLFDIRIPTFVCVDTRMTNDKNAYEQLDYVMNHYNAATNYAK